MKSLCVCLRNEAVAQVQYLAAKAVWPWSHEDRRQRQCLELWLASMRGRSGQATNLETHGVGWGGLFISKCAVSMEISEHVYKLTLGT